MPERQSIDSPHEARRSKAHGPLDVVTLGGVAAYAEPL